MGRFHRHDDGEHAHTHGEGHGDHSGYHTAPERIEVLESIFAENDVRADYNRKAFEGSGVRALNLMSSPGSGKTTILAATLDELATDLAIGIIEGDIATDLDAAKLGGRGAQIALLNTSDGFGGECHLDAPMVNRALQALDLTALDLVIIENVGNLVCPAEFDVGEHAKAMVYSVTEGEDKPLKYPVMFRAVDVVLLNKIDLVPYLDVEVDRYIAGVREVNPAATVLPVSARTGDGMGSWYDWLRQFLTGPLGSSRADAADVRWRLSHGRPLVTVRGCRFSPGSQPGM
jgi:hydrogenase nickel incorporation protein HypB